MKLSKKKVTLGLISILLVGLVLLTTHVNIKYKHVDSSIRMKGLLVHKMMKINTKEEMIAMSLQNRASTDVVKVDDDIHVEEVKIQGQDDNEIRVLVFSSKEKVSDAVGLLWLHGGGYAIGTPDQDAALISEFIRKENTIVVAPDYRHSVEAAYPAALNDCYETLLWMNENSEQLGINNDQLFVAGQSAGGGLTAATVLYSRDMAEVNVAFQIPIYPMINSKMNLPSAIGNEELLWNSDRNHIAWQLYLGDLYMTDEIPKYASPSEEKNKAGLPPAYTYVGTLDPFYDETIQYVNELKADEVEVTYHVYDKAYHGFDAVGMIGPDSKLSVEATDNLMKAYSYAVNNYRAPQN